MFHYAGKQELRKQPANFDQNTQHSEFSIDTY